MATLKFDLPKAQSSIIKVIGVGGGGNNAVNHMYELGIHGVDFINCNTDQQVLEASPIPTKISLGTRGLGAGANPEVGRQLAEESADKIREVLEKNTQLLFVTAGMGGGTGTGAAPVIASISRDLDILTVAIVTEPFNFEGPRRAEQAKKGIQELRKYVDVLLVIKNDKLREQYGNLKITEAFHKADSILANAAKGMSEIISSRGYINVDFEDAKTVMRNSSTAIMGVGIASGEDRATRVVEEAINSPLLDNTDITGAKKVLLYVTYGEEEVRMDELAEIMELINDRTGNTADINMGQGHDPSLGENIAITLVVTGFNSPSNFHVVQHLQEEPQSISQEDENQEEKVVVSLYEDTTPTVQEPVTPHFETIRQDPPATPSYAPENQVNDIQEIKLKSDADKQEEEITEIRLVTKPDPELTQRPPSTPVHIINPEAQQAPQQPQPAPPPRPSGPIKVINVDDFDDYEMPEAMTSRSYETSSSSNNNPSYGKNPQEHQDEHLTSLGVSRQKQFSKLSLRNRSRDTQEKMEAVPAYLRRDVKFSDVPDSSESSISRYSLFDGENGMELRPGNSFLHDNVD